MLGHRATSIYISYTFLYIIFAVDAVYLLPWALVLRDQHLGVVSLVEIGIFDRGVVDWSVTSCLSRITVVGARAVMTTDLPMPRVGAGHLAAPKPMRLVLN